MRISVFGLGYVGAVSLGCLTRDGHSVIGVDINPDKLDLIRGGMTPIIEEGMSELIAGAASSGRMEVSDNTAYAVSNSDISFICVGTPSQANGGQDLSAMIRLSESLGLALESKKEFHVIVVRSTVLPGTVEDVIRPLIENTSGKKAGKDFGLCFQPEFLREGSSIRDYYNPPYTVVGCDDERSASILQELFGVLPAEFIRTSVRSAEMLKYCCNAFHALKVTFANEVGRISQVLGVNSLEVMQLVCKDTRLNISTAYLRPGFAFGGSCLPKDLRALVRIAQTTNTEIPMLSHILPSNRLHVEHALRMVLDSGAKSVGLVGLSFKSGTDDLRESPLVVLAEQLIGKGVKLRIYDPEVNVARLVGANRQYIENSIPHISSLMHESLEAVIAGSEIVILGLGERDIVASITRLLNSQQTVIDLVGIPDGGALGARYHGVCW